MNKKTYIHPSEDAGKKFYMEHQTGSVVMLNLLKFRKEADYSGSPELKPENTISGKEAYRLYMKYTSPLIEKAGSEVLFFGKSSSFLIGPETEGWDEVLLVKHESAAKFIAFANDPEYLKTAGHRTAALEDSRLLPIREVQR